MLKNNIKYFKQKNSESLCLSQFSARIFCKNNKIKNIIKVGTVIASVKG